MTGRKSNSPKARKRALRAPLDLTTVAPRGRVDVMALRALERFAQCSAPELLPLLTQHKEVIHASLNSRLGPHAIGFDVASLIEQAQPFFPLLSVVAQSIMARVQSTPPGGIAS